MKILSLIPYKVLPARAGGPRHITLQNKYMSRLVELICVTTKNNDPSCAEYPVMNILGTSPLRYINPLYFFTLRKIIRQERVTHLMLEHPYYGWLGILLKMFTGVKLITRSSNIEAIRWKSMGKWWWRILFAYEKLTHRKSDYNLFVQEDDRQFAITRFGLRPELCHVATYGIEMQGIPPAQECAEIKKQIKQQYNIAGDEHLLFFNSAFGYKPNDDAFLLLTEQVAPLLRQKQGFRYKIVVCGMNIPDSIARRSFPDIIIAGFVDDITRYYKAADVFLNPLIDGGGIKTKLVDSLVYNRNAVSTVNGAIGVDPLWCNGKLLIVANEDMAAFASAIVQATGITADTPPAFFDHFYGGNIARDAVKFLQTDYRNL